MKFIHFFTLGYYSKYLSIGIPLGIIVGLYSFFRIKYALNKVNISKTVRYIICSAIGILLFAIFINPYSNASLHVFYLFLSSLAVDIIRLIWKYVFKNKHVKYFSKIHKTGLLALIIYLIVIIISFHGITHVELTEYHLETNKINNGKYSILFLSDLHYGTIQDKKLLKDSIPKMNELKPDIVVLGGDIVDERTKNEDMKEVFTEFGKLNSTYGVYYVYGNHDTQPLPSDYEGKDRTFTDEELVNAIKSNGIKILEDEKVIFNNEIVLVGRSDALWDGSKKRINVSEILNKDDLSKYIVVADHQPLDEELNAKSGVDLQISGHNHGGQVFPYGEIIMLSGWPNYGVYEYDNMKLIMTSGFTGWGFPMRNEKKCEYVLINIG